jgi:hypothetical protein
MNDNALIDLFATQLEAASAAAGWNYGVVQKDQPTQQGIDTAPTIYFEKLFDKGYGWPALCRQHVAPVPPATQGVFQTYEKQWTETTFQVSALVIQDPNDLTIPTASDVVNFLKLYVNSRPVRYLLKPQGVTLLRIVDIRNPYFEDDRDMFEATPSFDVVVQHMRTFNYSVPGTNIVKGKVVEDFTDNGIYPVPESPSALPPAPVTITS